ncbi:MAG: hypothetical protein A2481_03415 [Candidatus Yonathbacteria bacterium RIFOXYC2_FULL_47_9]|nr:MAG: hypothetical protein A2481_03415 [Candidatus Yonathbacteria bacterium RIFOXYC2_FULL_47_9]HAT68350.1 hypothetical protein [Candidatus Yonathbacteria bacterium]
MNAIKSLILAVVFLFNTVGFSSLVNAAPVSGQGTWETTLSARSLDGNNTTAEAYYDSVLDITWLKDANVNGLMTWANANTWASSLVMDVYTNWRLPDTVDTGTVGCNFSNNGTDCGYNVATSTGEMASMFYDTLGDLASLNTAGLSQAGSGLTNTGPFSNIQAGPYWSATENAGNLAKAWSFVTANGLQSVGDKSTSRYSWAVHSGDVGVAVVPEPSPALLFASGLLALVVLVKRKAHLRT